MKSYKELLADATGRIKELFPWDLSEKLEAGEKPLLIDVREPHEFNAMHIPGSVNVPRGVLESACDWGYDDTVPALVEARDKEVVVICRSGNRSAFAADTMQAMGYTQVISLKTGVRGWNEFDQPLEDADGNAVDPDDADEFLASKVSKEQLGPDA